MPNEHAVVAHWKEGFDEARIQKWAARLRRDLSAPRVSLGLLFVAPSFFSRAAELLEILRVHAQIPLLCGCSSTGLIAGEQEAEDASGFVLGLYHFPGAQLTAARATQEDLELAGGPEFWHKRLGAPPSQSNGWLAFADPFHMDCDSWIKQWNDAYAPLPILGGLASGSHSEQRTQVYLNGNVFEEGAVGVSFGGEARVASVISQGCTPIGETWTITRVERNIIHEIGNRPAYEVLMETVNGLDPAGQKKIRGNLFIGIVINEYLDEFHRGDFLIRNLLGADPRTGSIAVGELPRAGQTIQFQRRDADAATEDMAALLDLAHGRLDGETLYGACLCVCNGRGQHLFGEPNHDAQMVQERLGPTGLSGFFCNGEIGPVGNRNFLHGYTASLALFLKK